MIVTEFIRRLTENNHKYFTVNEFHYLYGIPYNDILNCLNKVIEMGLIVPCKGDYTGDKLYRFATPTEIVNARK